MKITLLKLTFKYRNGTCFLFTHKNQWQYSNIVLFLYFQAIYISCCLFSLHGCHFFFILFSIQVSQCSNNYLWYTNMWKQFLYGLLFWIVIMQSVNIFCFVLFFFLFFFFCCFFVNHPVYSLFIGNVINPISNNLLHTHLYCTNYISWASHFRVEFKMAFTGCQGNRGQNYSRFLRQRWFN